MNWITFKQELHFFSVDILEIFFCKSINVSMLCTKLINFMIHIKTTNIIQQNTFSNSYLCWYRECKPVVNKKEYPFFLLVLFASPVNEGKGQWKWNIVSYVSTDKGRVLDKDSQCNSSNVYFFIVLVIFQDMYLWIILRIKFISIKWKLYARVSTCRLRDERGFLPYWLQCVLFAHYLCPCFFKRAYKALAASWWVFVEDNYLKYETL